MTLIIGQRKNGNSKQDFLTITNVCNISDTFFFPHEYLLEQTSQKRYSSIRSMGICFYARSTLTTFINAVIVLGQLNVTRFLMCQTMQHQPL